MADAGIASEFGNGEVYLCFDAVGRIQVVPCNVLPDFQQVEAGLWRKNVISHSVRFGGAGCAPESPHERARPEASPHGSTAPNRFQFPCPIAGEELRGSPLIQAIRAMPRPVPRPGVLPFQWPNQRGSWPKPTSTNLRLQYRRSAFSHSLHFPPFPHLPVAVWRCWANFKRHSLHVEQLADTSLPGPAEGL